MKGFFSTVIILLTIESQAQYNNKDFSISLNCVYTTSARIYKQPYASDPVIRTQSFQLEDILNFSSELKYALTPSLFIGLGSEYMEATSSGSELNVFLDGAVRTIYIEDGFSLVPVEVSLYYFLPFSTEKFKFLMGGGTGIYIGNHIRRFGDAEVSVTQRKFAYGIHVSISMDYMLKQNISLRTEMKFRDPQFIVKSEYNKKEIEYEGRVIRVVQDNFDSKVNIDGVTFIFGIAYHF